MNMIGVLALQGGFAEHLAVLKTLGLEACEVRTREELLDPRLRGLIIPGGESTVMAKFIDEYDLRSLICRRAMLRNARAQNPNFTIYGTCAGLILLAKDVPNLQERPLGLLDVSVERNAYGRQVASFITDLEVQGLGTVHGGHFIRAPKITRVGEGVEVLASYEGSPVLIRQGNIWGSTFHPELAGELAIHKLIFNPQGEYPGS